MKIQFPMKFDHYGYVFGQRTANGECHSGIDLNWGSAYQDLGLPVFPMANGVVVYARNAGAWGNLVVIWHPELGVWTRYAHLDRVCTTVGSEALTTAMIGTCGKTGDLLQTPHLHFDIIKKEIPWTQYTKGWTLEQTKQIYVDPIPYIKKKMTLFQVTKNLFRKRKMFAGKKTAALIRKS